MAFATLEPANQKAAVLSEESSDNAATLLNAAREEHRIREGTLRLHSDNGSAMKGATMLATMRALGIVPSFSRPSVSDDNPFSEALFRTLKYVPAYPRKPFASLDAAWAWAERFVAWYNHEPLHGSIGFVSPDRRHRGTDRAVLAARRTLYEAARKNNPARWSTRTREWDAPASCPSTPVSPTLELGRRRRIASARHCRRAWRRPRRHDTQLRRAGPNPKRPSRRNLQATTVLILTEDEAWPAARNGRRRGIETRRPPSSTLRPL